MAAGGGKSGAAGEGTGGEGADELTTYREEKKRLGEQIQEEAAPEQLTREVNQRGAETRMMKETEQYKKHGRAER